MSGSDTKTQDDDKDSRMPAAALFESSSSVNDILREEALKSVVSIELNSLGGLGMTSSQDNASESVPQTSKPATRTSTSSSSSGAFLQKMLATLGTSQDKASESSMPQPTKPASRTPSTSSGAFFQQMMATMGSKLSGSNAPTAASLLQSSASGVGASGAPSASSNPPMSKSAIDEITSSRNWNNLGSHEDVNVDDVFQTQPDSDLSRKVKSKPKPKTDWNALMLQGLAAAATAETPMVTGSTTLPAASSLSKSSTTARSAKKRARGEKKQTAKQPPNHPVMKKEAVPTGAKNFFEPSDQDVLLGRGGRANNHIGNQKYLTLKNSIQERYMKADKSQKTNIAQELVDIVNKEWKGKFLKQDPLTSDWYEVDNLTARKKCSQTLREINTPEVRAAKRAKYTN